MPNTYQTIVVDTQEGVTTITLNRPAKKNAMNPTMHREMNTALDELAWDEGVRVLVVTGAGDSFCAGQDLKEFFADQYDKPLHFYRTDQQSNAWEEKLRLFPRPTIAAVNGWCLGGGLWVACVCDFAIAAQEAMFGLPEINFGVFPAGGSTKAPLELLAHRDALYLILTGENVSGIEADRMRLVNKAVPRQQLMEEVRRLAAKLKEKDPVALMMAKRAFWKEKYLSYSEALETETAMSSQLSFLQKGEWVSKGVAGFLEGRYKPSERSFRTLS